MKFRPPVNALHLGQTWIEPESLAYCTHSGAPSGSRRRALARFPDGKLRIVRAGVADSFFSIPAKARTGPVGSLAVSDSPSPEFRFYPKKA